MPRRVIHSNVCEWCHEDQPPDFSEAAVATSIIYGFEDFEQAVGLTDKAPSDDTGVLRFYHDLALWRARTHPVPEMRSAYSHIATRTARWAGDIVVTKTLEPLSGNSYGA